MFFYFSSAVVAVLGKLIVGDVFSRLVCIGGSVRRIGNREGYFLALLKDFRKSFL
jgi:hypothetical protein